MSFSYESLRRSMHGPNQIEYSGEEKRTRPASICDSAWSKKLLLVCISVSYMSSFMCLAILAPFFPEEAASRGVSNTISGWIFGVFSLVQFLASPLLGKLIPILGSHYLFLTGQFFAGGCTILFGMLSYLPKTEENTLLFIVFCFVLRCFLAIGCTANNTACFAIVAKAFPDSTAAIAIIEAGSGLGLVLGPSIGGVLFDVGGYMCPFTVIGGAMVFGTLPFMAVVPREDDISEEETASVSMWSLLKQPRLVVTTVVVVGGAAVWISLDPTLEPHLKQFNLSPSVLGLLFLLVGAMYTIFAPLWGYVTDRWFVSQEMMILGFLLSGVATMLLGPSPLVFDPSVQVLWLNVVALVTLGLGVGLAIIPSFQKMFESARKIDCGHTAVVHGLIAGLWYSAYALGEFVGPILAGWLLDSVGFGWCMTSMAGISFCMALILSVMWISDRVCCPSPTLQAPSGASTSGIGTISALSEADTSADESTGLLSRENSICMSQGSSTGSRISSIPPRMRLTVKSPVTGDIYRIRRATKFPSRNKNYGTDRCVSEDERCSRRKSLSQSQTLQETDFARSSV